jgi:hypothetical protein
VDAKVLLKHPWLKAALSSAEKYDESQPFKVTAHVALVLDSSCIPQPSPAKPASGKEAKGDPLSLGSGLYDTIEAKSEKSDKSDTLKMAVSMVAHVGDTPNESKANSNASVAEQKSNSNLLAVPKMNAAAVNGAGKAEAKENKVCALGGVDGEIMVLTLVAEERQEGEGQERHAGGGSGWLG